MQKANLRHRGFVAAAAVTLLLTGCPSGKRSIAEGVPKGKGPLCGGSTGAEIDLFGSSNGVYEDGAVAPWPEQPPAAQGLDGALLAAIGDDMSVSRTARSLVVIRNGKLVYERYFNGGAQTQATLMYSVEKSLVSLLTGIAIEEHEIPSVDARVSDLLPKSLASEPGAKDVTVRQLLTMSSGLATEWDRPEAFDRVGAERHRVRAILREPRTFAPGSRFSYSTIGTYLLGAILSHVSGRSLCDLVQDRLFSRIGVTLDHAHSDPDGYFSGSMFITPRELARVGQLVLQRGSWEGQSIVPSAWIVESMKQRWKLGCPKPDSNGYGYLWWLSDVAGHPVWQAEGAGGQSISIVPGLQLVVVATHLNDFPAEEEIAPHRRILRRVMAAVIDKPVDTRVAACGLRDIHRVRADGTGVRVLQDDPALDVAFDWSPDGSRIMFASDRGFNTELYTMAADGSGVRRLTRDFHNDVFPTYSPDGHTIAFASDRRGSTEDLYLMDADGAHVRSLVGSPDADEQAPTWSPDGRQIVFTKGERRSGLGALWLIDADGTKARVLLRRRVLFPRWSPDGSRIAFGMMVGGEVHVGVMELADRTVADLGLGDAPSWAPDGSRLAATMKDRSIEILGLADHHRTRLSESVKGVPLWSPDGRWIVVTP